MAHETVRLAEYAAALRYEDLPAPVAQQAKDCIIDTVAAAICGSALPWSRIVIDYAERIGHRAGIQSQKVPGSDRGAERAGGARGVEAPRLVGVAGGAADANHDFVTGDKGGDQPTSVCTLFLRDGESRR